MVSKRGENVLILKNYILEKPKLEENICSLSTYCIIVYVQNSYYCCNSLDLPWPFKLLLTPSREDFCLFPSVKLRDCIPLVLPRLSIELQSFNSFHIVSELDI